MKNVSILVAIIFIISISYLSHVGVLHAKSEELKTGQSDNQLNAQTFDIQQYRGKIVYLDFWASWCVPCRKSFPWMNKIQSQYSHEDFVLITINLDKKRELAEEFLKLYPANFKVFYDPKGDIARKYQIKGMPSSIIFNRKGKPVAAHKGFFSKSIAQYEMEIQKFVNSSEL